MKKITVIASTGIVLALFTQVFYSYCANHPEWTYRWYYEGWFPQIRKLLSLLVGWIPMSVLYLLIIGALGWLITTGRIIWRNVRVWYLRLLHLLIQTAGVAGFIVFFFYWFWGFNYATPSVRQRLHLETQGMLDSAITAEFRWISDTLYHYATAPPVELARASGFTEAPGWINSINREVRQTLEALNWPCPAEVPVRKIWPNGTLLRIATAGFYLPLTGEANFDAGMYPLQWPYVVAHELFHAYGITDEGDCNFLALLTCWGSRESVFKYSALMAYWRQVAPEYRHFHRDEFTAMIDSIPAPVRQDLEQIHAYQDRYPDLFPRFRHAVYNSYLKAHGVREGMASYNEVITLLAAWKREHGSPVILPVTTPEMPH